MIVFQQKNLRISLITSRLLRTETGAFCDLPTQTVQNRDFDTPKYTLTCDKNRVNIQTDDTVFCVRISDGKVMYAHFSDHQYTKKFGKKNPKHFSV